MTKPGPTDAEPETLEVGIRLTQLELELLEELRERWMELELAKATYKTTLQADAELEAELREQNAKVAAALEQYGRHIGGCRESMTGERDSCDCGWDDALASVKEKNTALDAEEAQG